MNKNALFAGIAVVITAVAMIASIEIFTRVVSGKPATFIYSGSFRDRQTDWDVIYGVTSAGLRVTCGNPKSVGTDGRRIGLVGDSFAFGQGVSDCETIASRLATLVPNAQVTNFGTIGIGIDAYQVIARDMITSDLSDVLILFYGNDISEVVDNKSFFVRLADASSAVALLRKVKRAFDIKAFLDHANVGKSENVKEPFNNIISITAKDREYFKKVVEPSDRELSLFKRDFGVLLKLLDNVVPRRRIWIAVVPEATTVSPQVRQFVEEKGGGLPAFGVPGTSYETIRMLASEAGVNFVDLFPKFWEMRDQGYFPHDLHWSAEGHELAARLIADVLDARAADHLVE